MVTSRLSSSNNPTFDAHNQPFCLFCKMNAIITDIARYTFLVLIITGTLICASSGLILSALPLVFLYCPGDPDGCSRIKEFAIATLCVFISTSPYFLVMESLNKLSRALMASNTLWVFVSLLLVHYFSMPMYISCVIIGLWIVTCITAVPYASNPIFIPSPDLIRNIWAKIHNTQGSSVKPNAELPLNEKASDSQV
jgi:hypothetical protein